MSRVPSDFRTVLAVTACAAILVACDAGARDSEDAPTPGAAAEASPGSSDPQAQQSAGEDFPIPVPEGGERITDAWDGTTGYITMRYPADRHDEIVDFYDDYTREGDWRRTEIGQGEVPSVNYMDLMGGRNITVDPPIGDHLDVGLSIS